MSLYTYFYGRGIADGKRYYLGGLSYSPIEGLWELEKTTNLLPGSNLYGINFKRKAGAEFH